MTPPGTSSKMTAVIKVFEDDNLRAMILGFYINERRLAHMEQKQRVEYDAIVGCISFCCVQQYMHMEWDPSHLHLYWPLRRINFPEDYYDCFLERTYDENGDPSWNFDAFDERDVGWAVNVMAKRYTMVSRFLSLMDQGMEYDK